MVLTPKAADKNFESNSFRDLSGFIWPLLCKRPEATIKISMVAVLALISCAAAVMVFSFSMSMANDDTFELPNRVEDLDNA